MYVSTHHTREQIHGIMVNQYFRDEINSGMNTTTGRSTRTSCKQHKPVQKLEFLLCVNYLIQTAHINICMVIPCAPD